MSRGDSNDGAKIKVDRKMLARFVKECPQFKPFLDEALRYSHRSEDEPVIIPARKFSEASLSKLYKLYQDDGSKMGDRWVMGQIASHLAVLKSKGEGKIGSLQALETAIELWVKNEILHGWIFVKTEDSDIMQAMLVVSVNYYPPVKQKDYTEPAFVALRAAYWEKGQNRDHSFRWHGSDIAGHTTSSLLTKTGIYHETSDLIKTYESYEEKFLTWREMLGEQFVGNGDFEKGSRWSSRNRGDKMIGARLVVDDKCVTITNKQQTSIFLDADDPDFIREEGDDEKAQCYTRVPLGFYVWCFHLGQHDEGWVWVDHMAPYVYRPELREKLILPAEHADLIDALTSDMKILMEDIVEGKSGGTTILCQGVAGTGKTLTAEVYSEIVKRPLYRIHSGQLGVDAQGVEKVLEQALKRSTRWNAVLLIDEADVFISARGDDLEKNAVTGVFLRTLEYYAGLLFLTTNRVDTVDEAILSRCIAQIKYSAPEEKERIKLWQTLGAVYEMPLIEQKGVAEKLAKQFVCTGRDIKGLLKLVTKFARHHKRKPKLEDFTRLATFKGL